MPDMSWVGQWENVDLREARDVLTEVKRRLTVEGGVPARISPYPRGTADASWGHDYFEANFQTRWRIVQGLKNLNVFKETETIDGRRGNAAAIVIVADLATVVAALERIDLRLLPPRRTPEPAQRSTPRTHDFWPQFWRRLGNLFAWVVMIVGICLVLGLAVRFIPGFGDVLIAVLKAISK